MKKKNVVLMNKRWNIGMIHHLKFYDAVFTLSPKFINDYHKDNNMKCSALSVLFFVYNYFKNMTSNKRDISLRLLKAIILLRAYL